MFVVGVICLKQMTRASVSGRTWAYQTKSAFSDNTILANQSLREAVMRSRLVVSHRQLATSRLSEQMIHVDTGRVPIGHRVVLVTSERWTDCFRVADLVGPNLWGMLEQSSPKAVSQICILPAASQRRPLAGGVFVRFWTMRPTAPRWTGRTLRSVRICLQV